MKSTLSRPIQLTSADLSGRIGQKLGLSDWRVIEQADANAFGVTTHDQQWIHTDPARAATGPFGRTIAHGYLTLSLATSLVDEVFTVTDALMVVNYGVDRVRFPAPLPVGGPDGWRRTLGIGTWRKPERYWPVRLALLRITSSGVPWATTVPPCAPAPGPMSTR